MTQLLDSHVSTLQATLGLLLCWLINKSWSFYSLSAAAQAAKFYSTFVLNFSIINSFGLTVKLRNIKYQHSSKPGSLCAML